MAKWIKYQIVCNEEEGIFLNKKLGYSDANLTIAQREAYNGVYEIIEDDKNIDKDPLAIELGGTGAKTAEEARKNISAAPAGYGLGAQATNIGGDLNEIVTNGWYCYNSGVCTNVPEDKPSLLFVESFYNTNYCKQTVTIISTGKIYTRMRNSGNWGSWGSMQDYADACFLPSGKHVSISSVEDLDGIQQNGAFRLASDPQITINGIRADMLICFVHNSGGVITQFALSYNGHIQVRSCWYGTWYSWKEVYTSDNVPTLEEIGAAPSGYGLGVSNAPHTAVTSIEQLNGFIKNGWFAITVSGFTIGGASLYAYWMLRVTTFNDTCLMHEYIPVDGSFIIRRYNHHGTWTDFEWENPGMVLGTEYRTTERWQGKAVYTKMIDFGALPNNTQSNINIGTTGFIIDISGVYYKPGSYNPVTMGVAGALAAYIYVIDDNIWIRTTTDLSSYKAYVKLKYTKD